jgi:spermidine synthase
VIAPSLLLALFFASGLAGLMYELLWMRELALVFGNTAQAAATTLAMFFVGLSAGQYVGARRIAGTHNPLRFYALLEAALAASAASYFVVPPLYRAQWPVLFERLGGNGIALTSVLAVLAAIAMAVPCFCMGATLPAMGQLLVRRAEQLAPTFGLLYAVQTIGGALGAFVAAFWLPAVIGFQATYALAMAVSGGVAALAYLASRGSVAVSPGPPAPPIGPARRSTDSVVRSYRLGAAVACLSGFTALAVEVLWTHMFSQALHNSVYSFAAILVTFLFALSLGGLLARALARRWSHRPLTPLLVLLVLSGVGVAVSPFVFDSMTDGLRLFASGAGWAGYVRATFGCAAIVMLVPGVLIGSVFPYTLRLAGGSDSAPGSLIGELAFWNTAGAVAGSLAAGFVLLPLLGLWASLRVAALLYILGGAALAFADRQPARALLAPLGAAVALFALLDPTRLPHIHLAPGEELKSLRETSSGTVAVTESDGVLSLKLDGHYTVGANGAVDNDRRQAELPMLLHPQPRTLFLLGLGTGISAGAALFHPVDRVTIAELVPGIVEAAREYFAPFTNHLFDDARVQLVVGDARAVLRADPHRYDVIIGDLFVPWHAGTGSLYTREHFTDVRDHLTDDGVFAQWLPLYQLSWREFAVIAHTMLDVFPLVTVWRDDFSADTPIVALVGYRRARPLDLDAVVANVRRREGGVGYPETRAHALALLFYAGNLTAAQALVASAPINTDDRPVIEYLAPATPMEVVAGQAEWLTGTALSRLWAQLAAVTPPDTDPYLAAVPEQEREYVAAGRSLHDTSILRAAGQDADAQAAFADFARRVPADVAAAFAGRIRSN